jgi:outer membrane protein assembly factor BamD (BamD/ComL family)
LADSARQEALGVKANVAARGDYNAADALYNQSASSYKDGAFEDAAEGYARTAELFIAARDAAMEKRAAADAAIKAAEEKAAESDALAQDAARIFGGDQE